MKTYTSLAICLLSIIAVPWVRAQKSVYSMPFVNATRLPPMESAVNLEEIAASYQTLGNIYTTEITGLGEESMEQTSTTHISDVKAVDAVRFLEFYMKDQLLNPAGSPHGQVEMSVIYFNEDTRWNLGSALGVLTFGVAMLLGVPHSTAVVDVELEASFYDGTQALITSHIGVGRGRQLLTMYSHGGNRKAHQKALKKALQDLNEEILLDPSLTWTPHAGTP